MPAGSELTSQAIAPGTTEYGQRQELEAGLAGAMGGAAGAGGAPGGGGALPMPENPLGALLSGEVQAGQNVPLTDGLSVGPGSGPAVEDPMMSSRASRLRQIATESSSPQMRLVARSMLQRMARTPL